MIEYVSDVEVRLKTCIRCENEFPFESFYRDRTKKDGRTPYCRGCRKQAATRHNANYAPKQAKKAKERYDADPLSVNLGRMRMTKEEYYEKWNRQSGLCEVCGEEETIVDSSGRQRRLSVDHDHSCCYKKRDTCGECNRGLLCNRCNMLLGYAHDNVSILRSAIEYLNKYEGVKFFEDAPDYYPVGI